MVHTRKLSTGEEIILANILPLYIILSLICQAAYKVEMKLGGG